MRLEVDPARGPKKRRMYRGLTHTAHGRAQSDLSARNGVQTFEPAGIFEDSLRSETMREIIRFAWGISSLGDFIVAMSDKGLVTLAFSSRHAAIEDALRVRFPEADVIDSQEELTDILEKVVRAIEEPEFDPGVPLDLCGTPHEVEVWSMLRAIPVGETTNYGALAARLGTRDAREVTDAIARNPIAVLVPCHRVIKKDGSISGYRWGLKRKRELLAREQRSATFTLARAPR